MATCYSPQEKINLKKKRELSVKDFLHFLTSNGWVTSVAGSILVLALLSYLFWLRPAVRSVVVSLEELLAVIKVGDKSWSAISERVRPVLKKHHHLASTWLETQERVVTVPMSSGNASVMFGSPKDLWNPSALLNRRFNNALAEAVPNILVGVGLFFTFVFLSLALIDATAALKPGVSGSKDTEIAISNLLNVAGGKFLTSLSGLLASILWTFFSKLSSKRLVKASEEFLSELSKSISPIGGETVMLRQLALANDRLAIAEESLLEAREQTGTFKRFETDLAVSLAGAINTAFTPQMEAMTEKLVGAIDGLSEKLGTMNQEALQKMLEDFAAMLKQATESEMSQLQETLQELADKLQAAGGNIGESGAKAGEAINEAGALLVSRVQEISENLAVGASNMEGAASSIKLAMNDLEVTVLEATNSGKRGALFVNEALEKTSNTIKELGSLTGGLAEASQAMESVGGKIANVVDTVEELSREQRAVVLAVKEVAPTALAAVERVTGVLDQAANQTLNVMQQTKDSMESTATTLGRTVASITEGVTVYTNQVAELHRKMDGQLAKAVGSFDKGVGELAESVEELAEVMQSKKKG